MSMTFSFTGKGMCGRCFDADATTEIYEKFDNPICGGQQVWTEDKGYITLPEIKGIRAYVCDGCLKPDDQLMEDDK